MLKTFLIKTIISKSLAKLTIKKINKNNMNIECQNCGITKTDMNIEQKQCTWCNNYFYDELTEDELNQQFEDDKTELSKMGYETGDMMIEVCDTCYNNRYSDENIENRKKYNGKQKTN